MRRAKPRTVIVFSSHFNFNLTAFMIAAANFLAEEGTLTLLEEHEAPKQTVKDRLKETESVFIPNDPDTQARHAVKAHLALLEQYRALNKIAPKTNVIGIDTYFTSKHGISRENLIHMDERFPPLTIVERDKKMAENLVALQAKKNTEESFLLFLGNGHYKIMYELLIAKGPDWVSEHFCFIYLENDNLEYTSKFLLAPQFDFWNAATIHHCPFSIFTVPPDCQDPTDLSRCLQEALTQPTRCLLAEGSRTADDAQHMMSGIYQHAEKYKNTLHRANTILDITHADDSIAQEYKQCAADLIMFSMWSHIELKKGDPIRMPKLQGESNTLPKELVVAVHLLLINIMRTLKQKELLSTLDPNEFDALPSQHPVLAFDVKHENPLMVHVMPIAFFVVAAFLLSYTLEPDLDSLTSYLSNGF